MMRIRVKCIAVVNQGVDKILIDAIDELAVPEERWILNLSPLRGLVFEKDRTYRITIEEDDN
jgi:hypothetical protein